MATTAIILAAALAWTGDEYLGYDDYGNPPDVTEVAVESVSMSTSAYVAPVKEVTASWGVSDVRQAAVVSAQAKAVAAAPYTDLCSVLSELLDGAAGSCCFTGSLGSASVADVAVTVTVTCGTTDGTRAVTVVSVPVSEDGATLADPARTVTVTLTGENASARDVAAVVIAIQSCGSCLKSSSLSIGWTDLIERGRGLHKTAVLLDMIRTAAERGEDASVPSRMLLELMDCMNGTDGSEE